MKEYEQVKERAAKIGAKVSTKLTMKQVRLVAVVGGLHVVEMGRAALTTLVSAAAEETRKTARDSRPPTRRQGHGCWGRGRWSRCRIEWALVHRRRVAEGTDGAGATVSGGHEVSHSIWSGQAAEESPRSHHG